MRPYVIRQGDSCATLALKYGFDMNAVWQDPANDTIRANRQDPHVLAPLDILYIPEAAPPQGFALTTGSTNAFTADVPLLNGRIVCIGPGDQPLAGAAFTIPELSPPLNQSNGVAQGDAGTIRPGQVLRILPLDIGARLNTPVPDSMTAGPWLPSNGP